MKIYKDYEDWFIKFIVKHQPIDSEDVNRLIQLMACLKFYDAFIEVEYKERKYTKADTELVEAIDKYQKDIFERVKPFLIVTGRN